MDTPQFDIAMLESLRTNRESPLISLAKFESDTIFKFEPLVGIASGL